jgi:hypothetical protein
VGTTSIRDVRRRHRQQEKAHQSNTHELILQPGDTRARCSCTVGNSYRKGNANPSFKRMTICIGIRQHEPRHTLRRIWALITKSLRLRYPTSTP